MKSTLPLFPLLGTVIVCAAAVNKPFSTTLTSSPGEGIGPRTEILRLLGLVETEMCFPNDTFFANKEEEEEAEEEEEEEGEEECLWLLWLFFRLYLLTLMDIPTFNTEKTKIHHVSNNRSIPHNNTVFFTQRRSFFHVFHHHWHPTLFLKTQFVHVTYHTPVPCAFLRGRTFVFDPSTFPNIGSLNTTRTKKRRRAAPVSIKPLWQNHCGKTIVAPLVQQRKRSRTCRRTFFCVCWLCFPRNRSSTKGGGCSIHLPCT